MLDRLIDTFFNWRVMSEYLPKIVEGFVLTVRLALAIVVSGIATGFVLAMIRSFRVKPVNFLIIAVVGILQMGISPSQYMNLARQSVLTLM